VEVGSQLQLAALRADTVVCGEQHSVCIQNTWNYQKYTPRCHLGSWVQVIKNSEAVGFFTEVVSTSVLTAGINEDTGIFETPSSCIVY